MTKEQIKKYDDTLADVFCFIKGIEFSSVISGNKKIKESI